MMSRYGDTMGDLRKQSLTDLTQRLGSKTGPWLYKLVQEGEDGEEVKPRDLSKSVGSSKNFPGAQAITHVDDLLRWTHELATDLLIRLKEDRKDNKRTAQSLTVHFRCEEEGGNYGKPVSKVFALTSYSEEAVAKCAAHYIRGMLATDQILKRAVVHFGLSAGKFVEGENGAASHSIRSFARSPTKPGTSKEEDVNEESALLAVHASSSTESLMDPNGEDSCNSVDAAAMTVPVEEAEKAKEGHAEESIAWDESTMLADDMEAQEPPPLREPPGAFPDPSSAGTRKRGRRDEAEWVDTAGYCPESVDAIPPDTWANLPPALQFELRAHTRQFPQSSTGAVGATASTSVGTSKEVKKRGPRRCPKPLSSSTLPLTAFFTKESPRDN